MVSEQSSPPIKGFNSTYRFLSNFYPSKIDFEGITYPTVEHAYQAAKTLDGNHRKMIAACGSPGDAKSAGRGLLLREDWHDVQMSIMRTLLRKKFYDPVLKFSLLATKDAELEETNYWHDQFWGCCSCGQHQGKGNNNLGKLLMELRSELAPVG